MERNPCVYIISNRRRGTLYVGVTSDLLKRVYEHKTLQTGFTAKYRLARLVCFQQCTTMPVAIEQEKSIKRWRRAWKIEMIEKQNPDWRDLWPDIAG